MSHKFEVIASDSKTKARLGRLITPSGEVITPVFLPVGSQATVKTLTPDELETIGATMILSNAYHLYLRPGVASIEKMGGLHQFMSWHHPILTDSGGYQIFSLARLCQVSEDGVRFRSHIDGSEHFLTPEQVIQFQEQLGADIIMTLDVCPPPDSDFALVRQATERTFRWAERCQQAHQSSSSALYGIVQGGTFPALRHQSSEEIVSLNFDGYGIGGLSLGERKELTWATLEATESLLPWDKPRYLMGVGSPEDILEGVARGVDIFDSALPTRVARNGALFTSQGRCNIRNASFKEKETPIDPHCSCYTCCHFSAAYLHHLFKCEELLAYRLATIHNLFFIIKLTEQIRETILEGKFDRFRRDFLSHYQTVDEKRRLAEKRRWLHR